MALPASARLRLMFVFLCVVFGTTWLAMKAGVTIVPPGFFSGLRWTTAAGLLLGWRWWKGLPIRVPPRLLGRLALVALLMIALSALLQQYGLRQIGSGLAAVITSGTTPVALLGLSIAMGQERFNWRQAGAIAFGLVGIGLLFGPKAVSGRLGGAELLGALGVLLGCFSYCAGSVVARPVMRTLSPAHMAAVTNLMGGLLLLVGSVLFEPGVGEAMHFQWGAAAWAGWLYLVLPSSLGASIVYFVLVRDWGASRAGSYAFISPLIAVLLGFAINGEPVSVLDGIGMALMLAAAALVIRRPA